MEFDEIKAIEYIKSKLPVDAPNYEDDDILNIIDIIFDYYEDNYLLNIDIDADDDNIDKIILHVTKMLAKDPYSKVENQHIGLIVSAELEYEESLL